MKFRDLFDCVCYILMECGENNQKHMLDIGD